MSVEFKVDVRGFDRLIARYPKAVNRAARRTLSSVIGPRFVRAVKKLTRVDTGELRRSTYQRIAPGEPAITIGYRAEHARYIEPKDDVLGRVGEEQRGKIAADLQSAVNAAAQRESRR